MTTTPTELTFRQPRASPPLTTQGAPLKHTFAAQTALALTLLSSSAPAFEIRNRNNDKCLDVYAYLDHNGARTASWECWGGPNQQWYWNGEEIRSVMNDKCLDIFGSNTNDGAQVTIWECNGGDNQRWYWDGNMLRSRLNGKCLEIYGFSNNNGALINTWDCSDGLNQQWYLR
ncbi:alpha-L-arabinofuranosidase [Myxococcus stipitatus DSM 14675]|uniref:Alpha-L-arabinofuranosidase n=1 Tax=Myxococcus stipitatus (strain DSM 14675 / JCM 12634 / Mx s8) TaxID=1278073 RepID=L7UHB0_MYXSD|nr:alpha-L-arabinofuranosidase [Myxococcus stipitatus DSM 14675]